MKIKTMVLMAALVNILLLTACNTTQGVGKDIQSGGKALERSAQW